MYRFLYSEAEPVATASSRIPSRFIDGLSFMASSAESSTIFFHRGLDERTDERALIREAIRETARALSESLAPEWIVVRKQVDDRTLYLVHYRTECVTVTANSARELAHRIRNGAFASADPDRVSTARSSDRSTSSDMPSSRIVAER